MLDQLTKFIRDRFHPLFVLRRSRLFVDWVMPVFDSPIACNLWRVNWKVYLRLARHLSLVLNSKLGEPGTGSLFLSLLKMTHPKIFWDIGANIGGYSWLLMSVNKDLQAVLFEPDPDNAWLIEKTISHAHLKNAHLIRRAVSNEIGTATFAVDKVSSATGSLMIDQTFSERIFGHKPPCITVETTTLDSLWKQEGFSFPDIIKIDVEMAEHLVFEGAMELIKESQPVIIFECSSWNKPTLTRLLTEFGYIILGADHPDEPAESAVNLLALPIRYQSFLDQLIADWRREYAAWETISTDSGN